MNAWKFALVALAFVLCDGVAAPKDPSKIAKIPMLGTKFLKLSNAPPTECDSKDCQIEVWTYAPNTFPDPENPKQNVTTCAAVVQSSSIKVSGRGYKITWKLVAKTGGNYQFEDWKPADGKLGGIPLVHWAKRRYQSRMAWDYDTPKLSSDATPNDSFSWKSVNKRRRDNAICHDPKYMNENDVDTDGKRCEIAYAAAVLDGAGGYCASYDPMIINTGN